MSGLTPEVKILQDTLILFAGVYFLINALEIAADKKRLKFPPDTLKMVASILLGIFMIGFYLSVASKNSNNVGFGGGLNNLGLN